MLQMLSAVRLMGMRKRRCAVLLLPSKRSAAIMSVLATTMTIACALLRQKLARDDAVNRRRLPSSRGSVCGLERHASAAAMTPGAAASFEVQEERGR
jgi:hypothetical protein